MNKDKNPTTKDLFEDVLKDFVTFEDDKILLSESIPIEFALFLYFTMPKYIRLVFIPDDITCECGAKTHKHQIVEWKMDKKYVFYKYYYNCPKCGKSLKAEMECIVDEGCCYTKDIRDFPMEIFSKEHISYGKTAEVINDKKDLNVPRQTVFTNHKKKAEEYLSQKEEKIREKLKEKNIEPSGFPGHDEAFSSIDKTKTCLFSNDRLTQSNDNK